MTTANKITLIRILMIPAFVLMAIYYGESIKAGEPLEWQRYTAIAIFLVAAMSDGLDGYIARRYNQKSALGVILDPIADKGLLLSGIITLSISNWSDVDPQYGSKKVGVRQQILTDRSHLVSRGWRFSSARKRAVAIVGSLATLSLRS